MSVPPYELHLSNDYLKIHGSWPGGGEFVVLPLQVVFGKIAHSNGGNMSRKSGKKSRKRGGDGAKDSSYQRALKKLHKAEEENQILKDANRALRYRVDMLKERLENLEEGG